jgi:hypothetical protein
MYFKICDGILQPSTKSLQATTTDKDWASKLAADGGFTFNSLIHESTEAFFLLVIENKYDLFKLEFVHRHEIAKIKKSSSGTTRTVAMWAFREKHKFPLSRYTGHGGTKRNDGWSCAGLVGYNDLYDKVILDRTPEKCAAFDK